jgi:uncharacterized sulfatase
MIRIPMIARLPGRLPAGRVSTALQSQVDFAPTFLSAAGIPVPGLMQGVNQFGGWCDARSRAREHVIVENRHNPTSVHLRTLVNASRRACRGSRWHSPARPCAQVWESVRCTCR